MKRGDYDHNHALLSSNLMMIVVVIIIAMVALGGLAVGLQILDVLS